MPPAKVELTVVDTSSEAHDWGGVFPLNNVVSGLHWFDRIYFEDVYVRSDLFFSDKERPIARVQPEGNVPPWPLLSDMLASG